MPVQLGEANWKPILKTHLPKGKPSLKQANLIDLDKQYKITQQPLGEVHIEKKGVSRLQYSASLVAQNLSFEDDWQTVKPLQYELHAQSDIRHFSMRQGLPTGAVYSVLEGADNQLWLGTNGEGVCEYTSEYLRCLTDAHGLSNNRIWDIEKQKNGDLWLATDRGINVIRKGEVHTLYTEEQPFDSKVNDILLVGDDVYIATKSGLYIFSNNHLYSVNINDPIEVNAIIRGVNSSVWLATTNGLYQFDNDVLQYIEFPNGECRGPINAMTRSSSTVWLGIKGVGLCSLDLATLDISMFSGFSMPDIQALMYDNKQEVLWVGDDSKGVIHISNELASVLNKDNGLSDHHIRDIMLDTQGNVWVATYGGGVNRIRANSFRLLTKRNGLLNERVSALAVVDDALWLGQYGTGIQVRINDEWYAPELELENQYVHAITQDKSGSVWVGTRSGLTVMGERTNAHIGEQLGLDAEIIHQIILSEDDCMYLATKTGLFRACQGVFEKLDLASETYVISVLEDKNNRLWFVTNGQGVFYIEDGILFQITEEHGLPSNWVYSLVKAPKNMIVIGTRRGVLAVTKEGHLSWRSQHLAVRDGLSNNIILSLLITGNSLWVGTERGSNRLNVTELMNKKGNISITQYTHDNGYIAVDSTLNTAKIMDGMIYWGSSRGVAYFNPDNLTEPKDINVKLLNVSATINDMTHTTLGSISAGSLKAFNLPANTAQVKFLYTHNDWSGPERVRYQTRLLGSNRYWSDPSDVGVTTYNQLAPGQYEFQVRTFGLADQGTYKAFSFTILPPWWQTWWAYIGALVTLVSVIYFTLKWRFEILKKQQRAKDRAEFSEALLTRKKQLLAEVSHEIRTPLSVLKMQIEGLEYNLVENTERAYEVLHRRISDINVLISDIEQVAMTELCELSLNIQSLDVNAWLNVWIQDAHTRVAHIEHCQFISEIVLPENLMIHADRDRLTQVLNNLLSNSLRYSKPPIMIQFKVVCESGKCVISLSDSAPGVLDEELRLIFSRLYQNENNKTLYKGGTGLGLAICQDLIVRHGGCIEATHSELGGVKVNITLPR